MEGREGWKETVKGDGMGRDGTEDCPNLTYIAHLPLPTSLDFCLHSTDTQNLPHCGQGTLGQAFNALTFCFDILDNFFITW